MQLKERVLHAVIFEIGAVAVSTIAVLLASSTVAGGTALGVSVIMATIAMVWNFVFNYGFDKVFTAPREARSLAFRVFHTLFFEAGLVIFTIPVLAVMLGLSLWQAFWADVGLTVLITVYAFIFNWLYDHVRLKFVAA